MPRILTQIIDIIKHRGNLVLVEPSLFQTLERGLYTNPQFDPSTWTWKADNPLG